MKPLITVDELRKLMPSLGLLAAGNFAPLLDIAMQECEIVSKPRRCAFLAQLAHESLQLTAWHEFASGKEYEGRKDLGNVHPGDGVRYKGRGPIQLTGRNNYRRFGHLLGLDLEGNPDLAMQPAIGFRVAATFWALGGLNELADKLQLDGSFADRTVFSQITKRINGGTNGLTDRLNYFRVAKQVLHADDPVGSSPVAPVAPPAVRPAESVRQQEEDEESLLDAAVTSNTAKAAGLKVWPRVVKHSGAGITFVGALIEAHQMASIFVVLVLLAGIAWLIYHNRQRLRPVVLRILK